MGGPWPPTFRGHCMFARKDRDTLIEQSRDLDTLIEQSQYSEKQCSKLLSYVCVVIRPLLGPLQINFLFPVHRPHLVTASSKYSIIPYSSIIFQLFLHTDRLSKSYLETVTAHVSAVLSSRQNFTFVLFLQLTKEGTSLSMLLCSLFGCARH